MYYRVSTCGYLIFVGTCLCSTNPNGSKEFSLSKASVRSCGRLNRHGGESGTGPEAFVAASAARGPEESPGPAAAAAQAVVNKNQLHVDN